ncbi:MAG: tetratricopeptide repeat protein [Deltaproteobacteria bacterium]|nr:tetratricopeptide repeat protein [Deltaproteobacteria bacterium]
MSVGLAADSLHRRATVAVRALVLAIGFIGATDDLARAGAPAWNTEPHTKAAIDHLARGRSFYKLQRWDEAIAEFEAGALAEPTLPIWLWNLGQTHRQAGHYEKAAWYYERFIADSQDDAGAAEPIKHARQFVVDMHAAASREPRALAPDADVAAAPSTATGTTVPAAAPGPSTTTESEPRWYQDRIGWTLLGAGLIGTAVGGSLLLHANTLDDQAGNEPNFDARARLYDRAGTQRTIGVVTLAAGGAVAVLAVIKLAHAPHRRPSALSSHVGPGPGTFGLALSVGF